MSEPTPSSDLSCAIWPHDHPSPHDDRACARALLTEAVDGRLPTASNMHFPPGAPGDDDALALAVEELTAAAGAAIAEFVSDLISHRHGRGCIQRAEEDIATEINARGMQPYCIGCGDEVHLFPEHDGWQHYKLAAAGDAEVVSAGHPVALGWRDRGQAPSWCHAG